MTATIIFRVRLADWKAIRKAFPSFRGESAADYFHRLRIAILFKKVNLNGTDNI